MQFEHSCVERAAAQVIDRNERTVGHNFVPRRPTLVIVDGRRHRFGHKPGSRQADAVDHLAQQVEAVSSPGCGVGQDQIAAGRAHFIFDLPNDRLQQQAHEVFGQPRLTTDNQRCRVAKATLELSSNPVGLGRGHGQRVATNQS